MIAYESVEGSALLAEVSYNQSEKKLEPENIKSIDIPVASLGRPMAADISDNFEWLAISSETRGALWNLASGERKMHVRGFRGALVADSGATVGDFSKLEDNNHSLVIMRPSTQTSENLREVPEAGARQYRRFLLVRKSLRPDSNKESDATKGSLIAPALNRQVRFELIDVISNKSVWSAEFPKEAPQFFIDEFSERLVLFWALGSDAGKARLKENPVLAAQAREMGNKDDDYLVEIVDAFAGKVVGSLLLETGNGSFDIAGGFSEGDWLLLRDSENRLLAYSIKDGTLHHRFFGSHGTINPVKNQLAIENYPGELSLYDLTNGESQSRLRLPSSASFIRFSLNGRKLFVLDGQQTAYVFDIEKLVAKPTPRNPH